jgi:Ser/Thr protein kinase RdoA (MazF antagonist)
MSPGEPAQTFDRRRLRALATAALRSYGIVPARLVLLSAREHFLFRVDAGAHSTDHDRFTLRLYHPAAYDEAGVAAELAWLAALRRDTALAVPEPLPTIDAGLLVTLGDANAGEPRHAALCRWVPGRRRRASLTPAALAAVGRFTAELHRHAARFTPPTESIARRWDWERVFGGASVVGPESTDPLLTREQHRAFAGVATLVRAALDRLGTAPEVYGMVHGDLHTANYLFERGHVGAIDFEDCGLGHYLYDLAVILDEVLARFPEREPTFRTALLQGYRAVRPLPAEHEALLDTFIAMRLAELIRWYGSAADPAVRAQAHTLIAEAMRHFARLEPAAW